MKDAIATQIVQMPTRRVQVRVGESDIGPPEKSELVWDAFEEVADGVFAGLPIRPVEKIPRTAATAGTKLIESVRDTLIANAVQSLRLAGARIIITLEGGIVQDVTKPTGIPVEIRDYDVEGSNDPRIVPDSEGYLYIPSTW